MDSVGSDIPNLDESVPAMKSAIADVGGDPSELQVQGTVVLVKNADGAIDINASVAPVPKQVAAGATDVRFAGSLPRDLRQATEQLSQLVTAFREVTQGRG